MVHRVPTCGSMTLVSPCDRPARACRSPWHRRNSMTRIASPAGSTGVRNRAPTPDRRHAPYGAGRASPPRRRFGYDRGRMRRWSVLGACGCGRRPGRPMEIEDRSRDMPHCPRARSREVSIAVARRVDIGRPVDGRAVTDRRRVAPVERIGRHGRHRARKADVAIGLTSRSATDALGASFTPTT